MKGRGRTEGNFLRLTHSNASNPGVQKSLSRKDWALLVLGQVLVKLNHTTLVQVNNHGLECVAAAVLSTNSELQALANKLSFRPDRLNGIAKSLQTLSAKLLSVWSDVVHDRRKRKLIGRRHIRTVKGQKTFIGKVFQLSFFVEVVLSVCWLIDSGEINPISRVKIRQEPRNNKHGHRILCRRIDILSSLTVTNTPSLNALTALP